MNLTVEQINLTFTFHHFHFEGLRQIRRKSFPPNRVDADSGVGVEVAAFSVELVFSEGALVVTAVGEFQEAETVPQIANPRT